MKSNILICPYCESKNKHLQDIPNSELQYVDDTGTFECKCFRCFKQFTYTRTLEYYYEIKTTKDK